jgi:hypothetical protein
MRIEKLGQDGRQACKNRSYGACNWCTQTSQTPFCLACGLNRTVPDLSWNWNQNLWRRLELAKHRMIYDLLRLGLPVTNKAEDDANGFAFDLLSNMNGAQKVTTGHFQGVITLDIAEADDAAREAHRARLREPYRTLLGHFRHEVGHHYWNVLIANTPELLAFRALFGNEEEDYGAALQRHYQNGPRSNWGEHYVSAYASSHPWEDWAECFAHFLHIVSTLDTAAVLPLAVGARIWQTLEDPYKEEDFSALIDAWLPLAETLNELNRSMGATDAYPFVLTPAVIGKLHFVHMIVRKATRQTQQQSAA